MHLLTLQILSISTSLLTWIIISSCCYLQWRHYKRKLSSITLLLPILFAIWTISTFTLYESFVLCESLSLMSGFKCLLNILNNLVTGSLGGCIIWEKYISRIIKREFRLSFPRITNIPIALSTQTTKKILKPNKQQQKEIYSWLHKPDITSSKVTLKLIAKDILIAPSALSAFIKQELGIKFSDYITSRRLDNAEKALIDKKQNKTIIEIAEETGFQSPSTFYRDFTKRHQIPPLKWREQALAKMNPEKNS